jgi:hypothetical protein
MTCDLRTITDLPVDLEKLPGIVSSENFVFCDTRNYDFAVNTIVNFKLEDQQYSVIKSLWNKYFLITQKFYAADYSVFEARPFKAVSKKGTSTLYDNNKLVYFIADEDGRFFNAQEFILDSKPFKEFFGEDCKDIEKKFQPDFEKYIERKNYILPFKRSGATYSGRYSISEVKRQNSPITKFLHPLLELVPAQPQPHVKKKQRGC